MIKPVIIFVHKVIIRHEKSITKIFLIAKNRIIYYNAVLDISVTSLAREEIQVLDLMALIIGWALLAAEYMSEVLAPWLNFQRFYKFVYQCLRVKLRSIIKKDNFKVLGSLT